MSRPDVAGRRGFALPLAVIALVALSLFVALLIDGALEDVRGSRGDLAAARAQGRAESAMADALAMPVDSTAAALPAGAVIRRVSTPEPDSSWTVIQALGGGLARVVVGVRGRFEASRAYAGGVGLLRLEADSAAQPVVVRLRKVAGPWWIPLP